MAKIASAPRLNIVRARKRSRARVSTGLSGDAVMQPFQPATVPAPTA
jgi:hypothetical protein